jgi:hypothetical protein
LERPSRRQQAERIEALAERGLDSEAITERLGLARSTVNKPTRSRRRAGARAAGALLRPLPRLRAPDAGQRRAGARTRVVPQVRAASAPALE